MGDGGERGGQQAGTTGLDATPEVSPAANHRLPPVLGETTGAHRRARLNLEALALQRELNRAGEPATPAQQEVLAQYVGWGGVPQIFDGRRPEWANERTELAKLVSPGAYKSMRASTLNAHYTSLPVIRAMYQALAQCGYDGQGRVLEPAAGIGHFIGAGPDTQQVTAVELDPVSAGLARLLYPRSTIHAKGFEDFDVDAESAADGAAGGYDLVVGNPPFGRYRVYDPRHKDASAHTIHNYFMIKALRALRPGGMAGLVVSRYFLDGKDARVRDMVADCGDLVGAVRLPNTAFQQNAGTEVVTDLLLFQRRGDDAEPVEGAIPRHLWTGTAPLELENTDGIPVTVWVNQVYHRHPEWVLGEPRLDHGLYGGDEYTVSLDDVPAVDQQTVGTRLANLLADQVRPGLYRERTPEPETEAAEADLPSLTELGPPRHLLQAGGLWAHGPEGMERIFQLEPGPGNRVTVRRAEGIKEAELGRLVGLLAIRNAVRTLLEAEWDGEPDATRLLALREQANQTLDDFLARFCRGTRKFNSQQHRRLLHAEPDRSLILSLYNDEGGRKADILLGSVYRRQDAVVVDSPEDAALLSIAETGHFDMGFCMEHLGRAEEEIAAALEGGGLIFRNPEPADDAEAEGNWLWHEDYLSGPVRAKLRQARERARVDSIFERHVAALERVLPPEIGPSEIQVHLGSHWMPASLYSNFIRDLTGQAVVARRDGTHVHLRLQPLSRSERWNYQAKHQRWRMLHSEFGTSSLSAVNILERIANGRPLVVNTRDADGRTVMDHGATAEVRVKSERLASEFAAWVWKDETRTAALVETYNETHNAHVLRRYDGRFLRFPGQATAALTLRRNQRDGAFRMIVSPSTLLNHVVGAGKTATAIAATQEQRRLGLARKPLVVVPGHLVGAWETEAQRLYPGIKILTLPQGEFSKRTRRDFLARLVTRDWDLVVASHTALVMIPNRPRSVAAVHEEFASELDELIETAAMDRDSAGNHQDHTEFEMNSKSVKDLERRRARLEVKIRNALDKPLEENILHWEDLGIDSIVVDEAHAFKNLMFDTSMRQVSGLGNAQGSKKAFDLLVKIRAMRAHHPDCRVAFLSGTPVANSVAEAFHMLRFLNPEGVRERNVHHFDGWLRTFAEIEEDFEIHFSGASYKPKTRLRNFCNLDGLQTLYREVVDSVTGADLDAMCREDYGAEWPVPKIKGGQPTLHDLPRSKIMGAMFGNIVDRLEAIAQGGVDPTEDNNLKCLNDARIASLDVRIRGAVPASEIDPDGKLERAAGEILRIHETWDHVRGTQLVFCDLSTPKQFRGDRDQEMEQLARAARGGDVQAADELELLRMAQDVPDADGRLPDFDVYNELKSRLIERSGGGLGADQIVFIHAYGNEKERTALYDAMNRGDIRVLIGSTQKMGVGMNVQERLVALHHLDAPWRPCDVEQREGRILRQGNLLYRNIPGFEVEIHRYGTQKTIDAFLWQTLETKQKALDRLERGEIRAGETMEDISRAAVGFEEMKALTSGDPRIMQEIQLGHAIDRLLMQARAHNKVLRQHRITIGLLEGHEERHERKAAWCERALAVLAEQPHGHYAEGAFGDRPLVQPVRKGDETAKGFRERTAAWRQAVDTRLRDLFADLRIWNGGDRQHRFRYRGVPVTMSGEWGVVQDKPHLRIEVRATFEGDAILSHTYGPDDTFSPKGLEMRLQKGFNNLRHVQVSERAAIKSDNALLAEALAAVEEPFPHAAELHQAMREHQDLCSELGKVVSYPELAALDDAETPALLWEQRQGALEVPGDPQPPEDAEEPIVSETVFIPF